LWPVAALPVPRSTPPTAWRLLLLLLLTCLPARCGLLIHLLKQLSHMLCVLLHLLCPLLRPLLAPSRRLLRSSAPPIRPPQCRGQRCICPGGQRCIRPGGQRCIRPGSRSRSRSLHSARWLGGRCCSGGAWQAQPLLSVWLAGAVV
jgi:hypothetical protein